MLVTSSIMIKQHTTRYTVFRKKLLFLSFGNRKPSKKRINCAVTMTIMMVCKVFIKSPERQNSIAGRNAGNDYDHDDGHDTDTADQIEQHDL